MTIPAALIPLSGIALLLLLSAPGPPASATASKQTPLPSSSDRVAFMRQHFARAIAAHDAVIRGDLQMAKYEARALANQADPPELPAAAAPYLTTMKLAARRAAAAVELEDVAAAAAAMLATCGDCHRAVGTMPALARPPEIALGGTVGHMLGHKMAVDLMVQGLTVPSASLWQQGAAALESAPLKKGALPRDSKVTKEILASETWVHDLAESARRATDQRSRIYVYSELIQSCGTCHELHKTVWGPIQR